MKKCEKYLYPNSITPALGMEWAKKEFPEKAPAWCSLDLLDGNKGLYIPMSAEEKMEYFRMLVQLGFKEIEIGFLSSSGSEFNFARSLVERDLIPEDVAVQVLVLVRDNLAQKALMAIRDIPNVIVNLCSSISPSMSGVSHQAERKGILKEEAEAAAEIQGMAKSCGLSPRFEYTPVRFLDEDPSFLLDACNAVLDVWKPSAGKEIIINLPTSHSRVIMPHAFAALVEFLSRRMDFRKNVILSVHPHNDRGYAVCTAEMALLAGAQRVEGALFGCGERAGNVDIVTLALNLFSHGVDPGLDFSHLPRIRKIYERLTGMEVPKRQPYSGDLVFSAFYPVHQEIIEKCLARQRENDSSLWNVPFLPLDPPDIGRTYDADTNRVGPPTGRGGISYLLKQNFGITIPERMHADISNTVNRIAEELQRELSPKNILDIFEDNYLHYNPFFKIEECSFRQVNGIIAEAVIVCADKKTVVNANGNGRLDAVSNIIKQYFNISYELTSYEEYALSRGSSSKAMAFVCVTAKGMPFWGAGSDEDIIKASIHALVVAVNKLPVLKSDSAAYDKRLMDMQNYIQTNYQTVTLVTLAAHFHLSTPYASKYIKEKSGRTFGELLTEVRMKKAKTLLANGNMTVETVSYAIGYPSVEHFTRLFKKKFGTTPARFRNKNQ